VFTKFPLKFVSLLFIQSMSKYVSRFALGLSNSVPGVRLEPSDILELPDIGTCRSHAFTVACLTTLIVSKSGSDMTDGCGYTTRPALLTLRKKYDWDDFPTSIQCRFSGTKVRTLFTTIIFLTKSLVTGLASNASKPSRKSRRSTPGLAQAISNQDTLPTTA
jgi:hypothetical protein